MNQVFKTKLPGAIDALKDPALYWLLSEENDLQRRVVCITRVIFETVALYKTCGHGGSLKDLDGRCMEYIGHLWNAVEDWTKSGLAEGQNEYEACATAKANVAMDLYRELREPVHSFIAHGYSENLRGSMRLLLLQVGNAWRQNRGRDEAESRRLFSFLVEAATGPTKSQEPMLVSEVIREVDSGCSLEQILQALRLIEAAVPKSGAYFSDTTHLLVKALLVGLAQRSVSASTASHIVDLLTVEGQRPLGEQAWSATLAFATEVASFERSARDLEQELVSKFGPKHNEKYQWYLFEFIPKDGSACLVFRKDLGAQGSPSESYMDVALSDARDFVETWLASRTRKLTVTLKVSAKINSEIKKLETTVSSAADSAA